MKTIQLLLLALLAGQAGQAGAFDLQDIGQLRLTARPVGNSLELTWPAAVRTVDGRMELPFFELQRSADLKSWRPVGERLRASPAMASTSFQRTVTNSPAASFYRVLVSLPRTNFILAASAEDVLGYGDAYQREFDRLGPISKEDFAARFPSGANYLPGISWDPTTAMFWHEFSTEPWVLNMERQTNGVPGYREFDYRLTEPELAVFTNQGFVVSERLGAESFAQVFYDLWHNDLPVFISSDALLQAWHRTYDALLEETEETYLFNSVRTMLDGMAAQVEAASAEVGGGVLRDSLVDADYFLGVARSLLAETNAPTAETAFWQNERVEATLADIAGQQMKGLPDFMGACRVVDFSQFKVRGHYTHSERLGRYFKCLMWLGRTDVAVAGGPFDRGCGQVFATTRELGTAIVLWRLLHTAGQFESWRDMEHILETYVGPTDSMTFGHLGGLLAASGIQSLSDVTGVTRLETLQTNILNSTLGLQNIRSDFFAAGLGEDVRYGLPRSFTVFGQKFIPDSWVFSQVAPGGMCDQRRLPGALDTAFAVLGNNQVVPDLVAQISGTFSDYDRPHAHQARDGFPYQRDLAAARGVMDLQTPEAWDSNLYMSWLSCLRELSTPTTDVNFPDAMRTHAWGMKTLNTQLASWTHMRHDTILYAKQSYDPGGQCVYPTGYVEPRVAFWSRFKTMVAQAVERIEGLNFQGSYPFGTEFNPETGEQQPRLVPLRVIQSNQVAHLQSFIAALARLETLARKEMAQECFTDEELRFIDSMMEGSGWRGCGSPFLFRGWYPQLFYRTIYWTDDYDFQKTYGCAAFDGLVSDVHTVVPSPDCGDPGSVLHEAVGRVNLLMVAVENGGDRIICAGPVLSHYEFEVTGSPRRLSDEEWRGTPNGLPGVLQGVFPNDVPLERVEGLSSPPWTRGYLVPRQ